MLNLKDFFNKFYYNKYNKIILFNYSFVDNKGFLILDNKFRNDTESSANQMIKGIEPVRKNFKKDK